MSTATTTTPCPLLQRATVEAAIHDYIEKCRVYHSLTTKQCGDLARYISCHYLMDNYQPFWTELDLHRFQRLERNFGDEARTFTLRCMKQQAKFNEEKEKANKQTAATVEANSYNHSTTANSTVTLPDFTSTSSSSSFSQADLEIESVQVKSDEQQHERLATHTNTTTSSYNSSDSDSPDSPSSSSSFASVSVDSIASFISSLILPSNHTHSYQPLHQKEE